MRLRYSLITKLEILLLILFSMAFLNLSGYILAGIFVVFLAVDSRDIRVSMSELILFFLGSTYFVFHICYHPVDINAVIIYLIGPLGAFLIGKCFAFRSEKGSAFLQMLIVLALGMVFHGVLNWVAYLRSGYVESYSYLRLSVDFWRNELVAVTNTGMLYTFAAVVSLCTLFTEASPKYKIIAAVVLTVCVAATFFFANRTLLYVLVIVGTVQLAVKFFAMSYQSRVRWGMASIVLIIVALIVLYTDIGEAILGRMGSLKLVDRIQEEDTMDPRLVSWFGFVSDFNFLRYPLGGGRLLEAIVDGMNGFQISYFHNLWLDTYNDVGAIPFLALMVFTIRMFSQCRRFRTLSIQHGRRSIATIFDGWIMAVVLNCCVEPVIQGNPYFFLMILMCLGAMEGEMSRMVAAKDRRRL